VRSPATYRSFLLDEDHAPIADPKAAAAAALEPLHKVVTVRASSGEKPSFDCSLLSSLVSQRDYDKPDFLTPAR
jgi:hypothetical protein